MKTIVSITIDDANVDFLTRLHADAEKLGLEVNASKFIRKLFRQDDNAFRMALQKLSTVPNWKEASRAIDELFIVHSVDPYSTEAKRFIEVIFERFHPQG